jgi:hypothetical protein
VLLGPSCPVQRAGQSCVHGYRTTIVIFTAVAHRRVRVFRSGADGRFRVAIRPGRYSLEQAHAGLPRLTPKRVTVPDRRFVSVTLRFDTGIR